MSVTIRTMTAGDLDSVASIESRSTEEPWSRALFEGELELPDESNVWLVAEDGLSGAVVGFAGAMVVADEAHVMNIAVDPGRRGRGFGRRLLARLLVAVVDRGAVDATLEVKPDNRRALALYRGFGFRRAGRRANYYADGSDALILWARNLPRTATSANNEVAR